MANLTGGNPKPGPGRPKGSKDKIPRSVKERVLAVWEKLEAENKGLYDEAVKDPQWFYTNFAKALLPKTIEGGDKPLSVKMITNVVE